MPAEDLPPVEEWTPESIKEAFANDDFPAAGENYLLALVVMLLACQIVDGGGGGDDTLLEKICDIFFPNGEDEPSVYQELCAKLEKEVDGEKVTAIEAICSVKDALQEICGKLETEEGVSLIEKVCEIADVVMEKTGAASSVSYENSDNTTDLDVSVGGNGDIKIGANDTLEPDAQAMVDEITACLASGGSVQLSWTTTEGGTGTATLVAGGSGFPDFYSPSTDATGDSGKIATMTAVCLSGDPVKALRTEGCYDALILQCLEKLKTQGVRQCLQLKLGTVEYNNDTRGCGSASSMWLVANATSSANYSNWLLEYNGNNIIPGGSDSFSVTSSGGAGWDQNFTLTNPTLNAVNPGAGTWNWFNKGAPCYRIWSLVTDADNASGWGKWTIDIERDGKSKPVTMFPETKISPVVYLDRRICESCDGTSTPQVSYWDGATEITDLFAFISEKSGIDIGQLEASFPDDSDLLALLKPCEHQYAEPDEVPQLSNVVEGCDSATGEKIIRSTDFTTFLAEYYEIDPDGNLIEYALQGEFVDCETGQVIPPDEAPCSIVDLLKKVIQEKSAGIPDADYTRGFLWQNGRPNTTLPRAVVNSQTGEVLFSGSDFGSFIAAGEAAGYTHWSFGEAHYFCPCPPGWEQQGDFVHTIDGEVAVKIDCPLLSELPQAPLKEIAEALCAFRTTGCNDDRRDDLLADLSSQIENLSEITQAFADCLSEMSEPCEGEGAKPKVCGTTTTVAGYAGTANSTQDHEISGFYGWQTPPFSADYPAPGAPAWTNWTDWSSQSPVQIWNGSTGSLPAGETSASIGADIVAAINAALSQPDTPWAPSTGSALPAGVSSLVALSATRPDPVNNPTQWEITWEVCYDSTDQAGSVGINVFTRRETGSIALGFIRIPDTLVEVPPRKALRQILCASEVQGGAGSGADPKELADEIVKAQRNVTGLCRSFSGNQDQDLGLPPGTMGALKYIGDHGGGIVRASFDGTSPNNDNYSEFNARHTMNLQGVDLGLLRFRGSAASSDYTVCFETYN